MLLHFDFEPQVPTWREFQQALETIAGQKVSMTGGPSSGGGPPRWTAKVSGLAGQLVTTEDACFMLDVGYSYLLLGDDPEAPIGRLLELEADEPDDSVALSPTALQTLRDQLRVARNDAGASAGEYLLQDLDCFREDLCAWLEARQQAESTVTATLHC